jgi:patatin-like phospholipase/acyl hydrolase
MVTILWIDGGGVRGILPARVLQEIRRRLDLGGEKRPFSELFDLIAGTSSGALIALAIALRNDDGTQRYSSSEIVELYTRRDACSLAIDDAGKKNLGCLAKLADAMIELNDAAIDEVCAKLKARKTTASTAD